MFVWILVLILWIALFSLILHDATKEDSNGSAIVIAARNLSALISWARKKSQLAAKLARPTKAVSLASKRDGRGEIKQAPAAPAKKQWWRKERRSSLTAGELELAILEAMKTAGYEDFVGVIVGYETPASPLDPNWAIRGVKFGKADRKTVDEALGSVVEHMQREYRLGEDQAAPRSNRRA
jgi:hypothetical protein